MQKSEIKNQEIKASSGTGVESDPVASDFMVIKKTFADNLRGIKDMFFPPSASKDPETDEFKSGLVDKFLSSENSSKFLKRLIELVFLIGALVFAVFVIIGIINKTRIEDGTTPISQVSPSQVPMYVPDKKSIYADDKDVLKLEQDLGVLTREIQNAQIINSSLNPTILDFDVKFSK